MTRSLLLAAALAAFMTLPGCKKEIVCPTGESTCGGACLDLSVDSANCGACAHACAGGMVCKAGACECPTGQSLCGGACVDLATSAAHCGACGNACATGSVCGTGGGVTACVLDCPAGTTACGTSCVRMDTDRLHCGACDRPCVNGESCLTGHCSSLQVACFASDEVRAVEPLEPATGSAPRAAGDGPIALATLGGDVWAAASLSGSLSRLPVGLAAAPTEYILHGNDFEYLTAHDGRVLIANAGAGTVVIVDPATGAVAGEIPVGASAGENIKGIAFATSLGGGERAFISLQGDAVTGNPALGQKVAVLDATGLGTCGLAGSPLPCLGAPTFIDLSAGGDAPGLAFPGRSVSLYGKVYVVLANLRKHTDPSSWSFGAWVIPAGPGKLAVVDPAGPVVSYFSLTAACENPGGIALRGTTLWVACAASGASGLAEVDLSGDTPSLVAIHATPVMAPGNVAFCGSRGFVTDQYSGDVYPFDAMNFSSSPPAATTVCPPSGGWAWAADVACATRP